MCQKRAIFQPKQDSTTKSQENVTNLMSQQLDSHHQEFYSNKAYKTVTDALDIFKEDDLLSKPGEKFNYTTHGFTLLSAVLEKCANKNFELLLTEMLHELGMRNTSVDTKQNIVGNRAKYYLRNKSHRLENVPEVDNSNKWAGGGMISNVQDLLTFANTIHQSTAYSSPLPFLRKETMEKLWKSETKMSNTNPSALDIYYYGLGWVKVEELNPVGGVSPSKTRGYWFHTGAAVGASSILLIKPTSKTAENGFAEGVCVAILVNLQDAGSGKVTLALNIAEMFENECSL
uniref:Beta-lactamase-related domain-containing protein n=1 Tax=Ditylenchus dipsaci TaxID=166011 RepID=A0A915D4Z2_9BILA